MPVSYFNILPEHVCIQIYQCLFKNVMDEFCIVYNEYKHTTNIRYTPPYVSFIENSSNLKCVRYNFYKIIKYCKHGYLSSSIDYKNIM